MTVSLVPRRAAGPTKAFRRNAQPAPARGCFGGLGAEPPTSELSSHAHGGMLNFAEWVPFCIACRFPAPVPPQGKAPRPPQRKQSSLVPGPSKDFLLQSVKCWGRKELSQRNFKAIAQLFDGNSAWILAFSVEDTLDGRLGNGGNIAQAIGRNAPLSA